MKIFAAIFALLVLAAGGWTLVNYRNQPPQIAFTRVIREPIAATVPTNGKVEPIEWAEARADRAGQIQAVLIERGARTEKGTALVELDSAEARAELAAAQARVSQVHADLDVIEKGGRSAELTAIAGDIDRERVELAAAQKELDTLNRLQARQAATTFEVTQAKDRVERALTAIRSYEQRRAALINPSDRPAADARLRDAEAAVALAENRMSKSAIRSPVAGTVYQFDLKPGAFLNAGDLVASIGKLSRVRVKVYVDEPDLGRVAVGQPVVITWDAKPGMQWKGVVDRKPTQIVALGTRQVGEVLCVIDNPNNELLPGTNVNAEIRTEEIASTLTIPKESIRRELGQAGVFVLRGKTVAFQKVSLGIGSTTRLQVQGLQEGDAVALPSDKPINDGMIVDALFR